jgi:hypothetical protein
MNQTANIARAIRTLFLADPTLAGLVPGGIIYGRQPAPVARPFASLLVFLAGDPQYTTGPLYVQGYTVLVRVWGDQFLATAGAIQAALYDLLTWTDKLAFLTDNAWTLDVRGESSTLEEQEQRLFGQFTFVAGARWLIQLQEQRI